MTSDQTKVLVALTVGNLLTPGVEYMDLSLGGMVVMTFRCWMCLGLDEMVVVGDGL